MENEKKITKVYLVGMQENGGCYISSSSGITFTDRNKAESKVNEYHAQNMNYMKVFTLYIEE